MKLNLFNFFKEGKDLANINKINLLTILKDNENQALGTKYNFKEIKDIKDYQNKVPLSQYEDYRNGNPSVYPVVCTLLTSGTSGRSKKIFLTAEALRRYDSLIVDMPMYLLNCPAGPSLHTGVFYKEETETILSSAYYCHLSDTHRLDIKDYVDGRLMFFKEPYCSSYVKLRYALACEKLISIQSIYLYEIGALLGYLEKHWRLLIKDMEDQQCSIDLPQGIKEEVARISISKARIKFLKIQFERSQGIPSLNIIWPHLAYISGIGHAQDSCVLQLKEYSKEIPIYYFAYASSECMCGIATQLEDDTYQLLPQNAFYEFIDDKEISYLPHEVIKGHTYELVITTFNGLYRYKTGDQLYIVENQEGNPRFRVLGRKNMLLNITGERVDEWTIRQALFQTLQQLEKKNSYFMIAEDRRSFPFRYLAVTDLPSDTLALAATVFDQKLQSLNPNYKKIRERNLIAKPHFLYQRNTYARKEKLQMKPSLILKEEELLSFLALEEAYA